jgi:quinoprotein glucose dehydrogenase
MRLKAAGALVLFVCVLVWAGWVLQMRVAAAQQPARSPIWTGVYTQEQARKGFESYSTSCARCHRLDLSGDEAQNRVGESFMTIGPALRGDTFFERWGDEDLNRLYLKIRDTMPPSFQAILEDEEKVNIVAYLLEANGFPAGPSPLTSSADALERIRIVRDDGFPTAPPSFRRVELRGCVVEGPQGTWILVADEGKTSYLLVNAKRFGPTANRRVVVGGLVYREGEDRRMNVSSLMEMAPDCNR